MNSQKQTRQFFLNRCILPPLLTPMLILLRLQNCTNPIHTNTISLISLLCWLQNTIALHLFIFATLWEVRDD